MNYQRKVAELTALYDSVCERILRAEQARHDATMKYGRRNANRFTRVPHRLYLERQRLEQELQAVDYEFGEMQYTLEGL